MPGGRGVVKIVTQLSGKSGARDRRAVTGRDTRSHALYSSIVTDHSVSSVPSLCASFSSPFSLVFVSWPRGGFD